jgi:Fasciclin domain
MQKSEPVLANLRDLISQDSEVEEDERLTVFVPTDSAFTEVSQMIQMLDSETFADVRSLHMMTDSVDHLAFV